MQQHDQTQREPVVQHFHQFAAFDIRHFPFFRGGIFLGLLFISVYPILIAAIEAETQQHLKSQKQEHNEVDAATIPQPGKQLFYLRRQLDWIIVRTTLATVTSQSRKNKGSK